METISVLLILAAAVLSVVILVKILAAPVRLVFKLLLNEDEAALPDLKPVAGPYYKWSDFRDFFLKKLQAAPRP